MWSPAARTPARRDKLLRVRQQAVHKAAGMHLGLKAALEARKCTMGRLREVQERAGEGRGGEKR